jgi:hypothetical protein
MYIAFDLFTTTTLLTKHYANLDSLMLDCATMLFLLPEPEGCGFIARSSETQLWMGGQTIS